MDSSWKDRLSRIRLLLLDVDGVLTDGSLFYGEAGETVKMFHVRDGLGVKLLMGAGVKVGIVTGRRSQALDRRCAELGITLLRDGVKDKVAVLDAILLETGLCHEEIAFVGDDLPDLSLMGRVGVSVSVSDAAGPVRNAAHWVTVSGGGKGAVREVCEAILKARGDWDRILEHHR